MTVRLSLLRRAAAAAMLSAMGTLTALGLFHHPAEPLPTPPGGGSAGRSNDVPLMSDSGAVDDVLQSRIPSPSMAPQPRQSTPSIRPSGTPAVAFQPRRWLLGWSTFYDYHKGQAAAGPALRRMLGKNWRGKIVRVSVPGAWIYVRLTDWCACGDRHGRDTLIDLDRRDFFKLWAAVGGNNGVMEVRVGR